MEDQIIKLHDEFVDKGMSPSILNQHECLWFKGYLLTDKDIGYILLDMQTWLREEHGIHLSPYLIKQHVMKYYELEELKYGVKISTGSDSAKDYNKILLKGLQEAIKLIE